MSEAGVPGMTIYTWSGLFGPAGLPNDIVRKLHTEAVKGLRAAPVKERLKVEGAEPVGGTPEEFSQHVRNELRRWTDVAKSAGIVAQ